MKAFVDTSALYALMMPEDTHHQAAQACFESLQVADTMLVSTNYILLECATLLQRRHGMEAAKRFGDFIGEEVDVVWITESQHRAAWGYWKQRGMRGLSLVDCSCVVVMHEMGVRRVFGFDEQFRAAGFMLLDAPPPPDRVAERRAVYRTGRVQR